MDHRFTLRLEKIEVVLRAALARASVEFAPAAGYLLPPISDLIERGGKRWRPLLMTLVCEASGGADAALPLVPLVEFSHNASLIHDDIEDNSTERRGKPALHLLYGADTAINTGSFLYFFAASCIEAWDAPAERKALVYRLWSGYMRRLHQGQAMDIAWHRDACLIPTRADYDTMCRLKTGVLARFAAVLGAALASPAKVSDTTDQSDTDQSDTRGGPEALAAESLGVGFQILDDVKNLTTGNPGKKRGDDIVEGKKSLPILLYLHGNAVQAARRLEQVRRAFAAAGAGGTDAPEVEALIRDMEQAGALEEARQEGLARIAGAREAFSPDRFPEAADERAREARQLLAAFPDLLR
jgi:octaprenyl-diphosphate synthase